MWLSVFEYLILQLLIKMGKDPVACIDVLCVGRFVNSCSVTAHLLLKVPSEWTLQKLNIKPHNPSHIFTHTKHFKGRWLWCAITHTCFLPLVSIILSCRRHMACGTGKPTFMQGRVMSFFQGVTISLLKETILAGTVTTEELMVVIKIHMVSTIYTIL